MNVRTEHRSIATAAGEDDRVHSDFGGDLDAYMRHVGQTARTVAPTMARATTAQRNGALLQLAQRVRAAQAELLAANRQDLQRARSGGLAPALVDRLTLGDSTIEQMAAGAEQVAQLPDPIGAIVDVRSQPSGIHVGRMRVPLGVIGIIYESRPNVTVDAAALCIKSGNAAILRGGSEAIACNRLLARLVADALAAVGLPRDAVQLVDTTDRNAVGKLVAMPEFVDIVVPRGGKGLIERLMRESRVPMIKHLDGVCHVYVDAAADLDMAVRIADNAKTQRYGTCNTMETLLVAERVAAELLPRLGRIYAAKDVELRGDATTCALLQQRGNRLCRRERGGLARRVPRADPGDPRRRQPRRGDRAHQHLRQPAHRCDSDGRPCRGDAFPARGGLGLGDRQCVDSLRRRLRVRARRRDRHQ